MPGEFSLYGVFVPTLLALMVLAYVFKSMLRLGLARLGFYRIVWHPALFNSALYVIVLGLLFLLAQRILS
ncbi:hypothetical protein RHOFW510R12_11775 [Rhodanobacter sp. FW510-R12]|jgi:Na+/phosphate symporter|uniref:DUF1656 domain-containing protein n=1 Tax=Rhodanobacter denitrificans TaxID=666685 RepID=M4NGK5_9GAMM|nr:MULTISPECIES: DUF1656 domain-containing protein [Rhodanobacter]AGG89182.1 Protein of unknown function (DUF1656) [Rhodanobacter denitrificans]AGG89232.1 Protein of unknown function (DUF1656) [Rhodanobacter denitrificans]UJJ53414.1 DUF1656 domain-containing protein [Rhodanobacter thiooxydans]UJM88113.1 DUF1656 domain-containing protein [Rhodanobacter denitrificans]